MSNKSFILRWATCVSLWQSRIVDANLSRGAQSFAKKSRFFFLARGWNWCVRWARNTNKKRRPLILMLILCVCGWALRCFLEKKRRALDGSVSFARWVSWVGSFLLSLKKKNYSPTSTRFESASTSVFGSFPISHIIQSGFATRVVDIVKRRPNYSLLLDSQATPKSWWLSFGAMFKQASTGEYLVDHLCHSTHREFLLKRSLWLSLTANF